jgi:hypothetical protein
MIVHGVHIQELPNYNAQSPYVRGFWGSISIPEMTVCFWLRTPRSLPAWGRSLQSGREAFSNVLLPDTALWCARRPGNSAASQFDTLDDIGHLELTVLLGVLSQNLHLPNPTLLSKGYIKVLVIFVQNSPSNHQLRRKQVDSNPKHTNHRLHLLDQRFQANKKHGLSDDEVFGKKIPIEIKLGISN